MYRNANLRHDNAAKLISLVFVLLMLATMAADCGGGGSGGSSGSTSSKACISVKIDKIDSDKYGTDVLGTVTNNCKDNIWMAKIDTTCYSSSGQVVDRDEEYVEDVASGGTAYYKSLIEGTSSEVKTCKSEVTDATFK